MADANYTPVDTAPLDASDSDSSDSSWEHVSSAELSSAGDEGGHVDSAELAPHSPSTEDHTVDAFPLLSLAYLICCFNIRTQQHSPSMTRLLSEGQRLLNTKGRRCKVETLPGQRRKV